MCVGRRRGAGTEEANVPFAVNKSGETQRMSYLHCSLDGWGESGAARRSAGDAAGLGGRVLAAALMERHQQLARDFA